MARDKWPTRNEYDTAILKWKQTVLDEEIRLSTLRTDGLGIQRYTGANLYICLYRFDNWMIRCFCSKYDDPATQTGKLRQPPADIEERYKAISNFCSQHSQNVSALLPITYIERGVLLEEHFAYPIVKMPFLSLPTLGKYVADNYRDRHKMLLLSDSWLRMISELEDAQVAHGDLDLTNVFVDINNPHLTLKLIDYDNMWIPALKEYPQTEKGHKSFQHPTFLSANASRPFNAEMDRFSALVMYISLKVLVSRPDLYRGWGADENDKLLLSASDYQTERNTARLHQTDVTSYVNNHIAELRNIATATPEIIPFIDELRESLQHDKIPRSLRQIPNRPASRVYEVIGPSYSVWGQARKNPNIPTQNQPTIPQVFSSPQHQNQHQPSVSPTQYVGANSSTPAFSNPPLEQLKPTEPIYPIKGDTQPLADPYDQVALAEVEPRRRFTINRLQLMILFLLLVLIVVAILWFTGFLNHVIHVDTVPLTAFLNGIYTSFRTVPISGT